MDFRVDVIGSILFGRSACTPAQWAEELAVLLGGVGLNKDTTD